MNELVYLKNEQALTDSLTVAEIFGKRHDHVLVMIENKQLPQLFHKTRYKDATGKWNPKYLMNKDGFVFLIMGFTGKNALEWKLKYIGAFNQREAE